MDSRCHVDNSSYSRYTKYLCAKFSVVILNFRFCLESSLFVFAPGGANTEQFVFPLTFRDIIVCFYLTAKTCETNRNEENYLIHRVASPNAHTRYVIIPHICHLRKGVKFSLGAKKDYSHCKKDDFEPSWTSSV